MEDQHVPFPFRISVHAPPPARLAPPASKMSSHANRLPPRARSLVRLDGTMGKLRPWSLDAKNLFLARKLGWREIGGFLGPKQGFRRNLARIQGL
jgi:hypothetical protein